MNIEELHNELPQRIVAEISDQIQFFLRTYADQQMRFVIYFGHHIDYDILKKAIRLTILSEHVFSYFYKEGTKTAWWQKEEIIDASLLIDLIEINSASESDIDNFLTLEVGPYCFPIVKARLFRYKEKDVFCVNMNHTPTDGAGLKKFVKKLASTYTCLSENREPEIKPSTKGDRSLKQVLENFTSFQKLRFVREGFRSPKKRLSWSFDWERSGEGIRKYITRLKINPDIFDTLKAYSKQKNVTINDIVLTAFIRSFVHMNLKNKYAAKPVIVPVDLRKHLKPGADSTICSLTGSLSCNIGKIIGDNFNETLTLVRNEMNNKKAAHSEMNRILQISVVSKFLPYAVLKEQLAKNKMPPVPLVTNVGIIDFADISFDNAKVDDAFVTGAISLEDYFSMAYSTFRNSMTFSIGYKGDEIQENKVKLFLNGFEEELLSIKSV
jgi:NRPS condensation-like uncharacterized protein